MAALANLGMTALRTFVRGLGLGSFGEAAAVVGRSPSAVSGQLRKLEAQVGEPLVAFDEPCAFRRTALAALGATAIPWRVASVSTSLPGLWAAVDAGLGITARARARVALPATLRVLDPGRHGLPRLPDVPLSLLRSGRDVDPAAETLVDLLLAELSPGSPPPASGPDSLAARGAPT